MQGRLTILERRAGLSRFQNLGVLKQKTGSILFTAQLQREASKLL